MIFTGAKQNNKIPIRRKDHRVLSKKPRELSGAEGAQVVHRSSTAGFSAFLLSWAPSAPTTNEEGGQLTMIFAGARQNKKFPSAAQIIVCCQKNFVSCQAPQAPK